jgi:hypothetical protein
MNTEQTAFNSLHPPVIAGASRVGRVEGFLTFMISQFDEEQSPKELPKNPPFPLDTSCVWCAGTGHPYGNPDLGICNCPEHRKQNDK